MTDTFEGFLQQLLNNYAPLPDAHSTEDRINKAVAFKEIMDDYKIKAEDKINMLLADKQIKASKDQLKTIAENCFQCYKDENFKKVRQ